MDESSINQNRRAKRSRVLLIAEIGFAGSALAVKLRDISVSGALIEGERLPPIGLCVVLRCNELQVNGSVIWSDGTRAGLTFDSPIHPEDVLRTIGRAQPKTTANFRRPDLREHQLSPEEQVLIKLAFDGVAHQSR